MLNYIGLDIDKVSLERASRYLDDHLISNASFYNLSSYELNRIMLENDEKKVLVVFPFNLFGNLTDPEETLNQILIRKWNLVIFNYQDNAMTREEREQYYSNCNIICQYQIFKNYSSFVSNDGFNSKVYTCFYMICHFFKNFIECNQYQIELKNLNKMENVYHLVRSDLFSHTH
jgi:hypothetical protein